MKINKMIESVGVDIVEHQRFLNFDIDKIKRILTKKEFQEYSVKTNHNELQYLCGRWAAKEAIFKAINGQIEINPVSIEILNDKTGKPFCTNFPLVKLSISHSSNYSIAFAIFLK